MAKLEFNADELIELALNNNFIPKQILNISTQDRIIKLTIDTDIPFPKFIDVSIIFLKYQDGILFFQIKSSWLLNKILRLIPIPKRDFIHFNLPNLEIALQQLINSKIKYLQIDSIQITDGNYTIITKK